MRVAIVHDWFVSYAGSERVVEQLIGLFPRADIFSLLDFLPRAERGLLAGRTVATSFLQRMPLARRIYPAYLPLMPLAIEQLDLSAYDLVISSSHCVAKGVLTGPDQLHISYVHTPMRYAWDGQCEYLSGSGLVCGVRNCVARWLLHKMRMWDVRTAHGVDAFVANSHFIARRIWKAYRREARVIYPPVDVESFEVGRTRDDFYLTASRLVPYKKIDVLVDAFAEMPDKKLVVIGEGPEFARLRAKAGVNVTLLGYQEAAALRDYLSRARAFLFAGREDFGIILVEAQACGTPVVAFGRGGAVETVCGLNSEEPTGVLFDEQTPEAVTEAIYRFEREEHLITAAACRENAMRFGIERFRREFGQFVEHQWRTFSDTVTQGAGPLRPGIASPAAIDRWTRSRRAA